MAKRFRIQSLILLLAATLACDAPAEPLAGQQSWAPNAEIYPFAQNGRQAELERVFAPPDGYTRVAARQGSFGEWLRGLPVRLDRTAVRSYRGDVLRSPSAAIVAIDVGERNLQQCADSAIRLHAEYLWSQRRFDDLAYHFTSGDEVRYSAWLDGERIAVRGASVTRAAGPERQLSRDTFREWLDLVFMYAGTRSLRHDSEPVATKRIQPGDFFVTPGSPGHAVVVLDIAQSPDGRRVALLGQGFMPAQEFHVLRAPKPVLDSVWFPLPRTAGEELRTPSWKPFHGADARRFNAP